MARLYVPLDVTFFDDDRILAVPDSAKVLYLRMCVRCKLIGTDGMLTMLQMETLNHRALDRDLIHLVRVDLVHQRAEDGVVFINAWLMHNDPIELVRQRRAADAERKRKANAQRMAFRPTGIRPESDRTM